MTATATTEWPRDGLEAVAACPVCGGERRVRMYDGLRDRLFSAPGEWALWRCGGCRSAYLDPRPTAETLGLAYADYMHHQPPPDAAPSGPLGALRERLLNGYLAARYGYRREPSLRIGAPLLSLLPPDPSHRDKWLRHLHWPGGEPSLLDVGCANGAFMLRAAALGWRTRGVDLDAQSIARAREAGLDATLGTVFDVDPAQGRYDAITLGHVIEHLPDPRTAIEHARSLLRPGGMLWLATPNLDGLGRRLFGASYFGLDAPRHLVLFTLSSLRGLLHESGFDRVETLRPTPDARYTFAWSHAIEAGLNPFEQRVRPPLAIRLKQRVAERASRRDPRHAEELIVAAWADAR